MYGLGYEFLSGSTFAGDQRRRIRGRQLADQLKNVLHRFAAPHDPHFVILAFEQGLIRNDLLHLAGGLERRGDELLQLRNVKRLE